MNVLKQITVPLHKLICRCNVPLKQGLTLKKYVCVMLLSPAGRGATVAAALSPLLEAVPGGFSFVVLCFA